MSHVILVADDDPRATELIKLYLERERYRVLVVHDGGAALEVARREPISLIVLDVMLPTVDGIEVCEALRGEGLSVPIILLTARTTEEDRVQGLDVGADDYVTKPFSPRELAARVRAVLRRVGDQGGGLLRVGPLVLDAERQEAHLGERHLPLTPTEFRLLLVLAREPGRPFSRHRLAERALGYDYDGLERTIDKHIANLRSKLAGEPSLVVTVPGVGYKLEPG
jgi:DNA-binding response OmpR family regulator